MSNNQIFKLPRVAQIIDSNTSNEEKIIALYFQSPSLFTVTELSRYFLLDEATIRTYLDRAKYNRYANK